MLFAVLLLPTASALVDCIDGFIGRMQMNLQEDFTFINDTRMCSAAFCIKVFVHGAFDDEEIFQQGISSRCAYTGGDRQLCVTTAGGCLPRSHYDGMHGNFTICCCQTNGCNSAVPSDISTIYSTSKRKSRKQGNSASSSSFFLLLLLSMFLKWFD